MIESKLKPICELCPALKVQASTTELFADGNIVERIILLECLNQKMCERLEEYLKKEATP